MADGLSRILAQQGFDPETFVKKQTKGGEDGLEEMRTQIQSLAEDTAVALKKNVYKNYSTFIETAKEISILEGEMYQLSHMLTDQKSIMTTMMEMSITGNKVEGPEDHQNPPEEDTHKNLAYLLEKVEGCSSVTEVPGRYLVHDGDLVEMDPESLTQINKVHVFLLNDSLMIATWMPQRGPVRYQFQVLYELDSLAVVNARDVGGCKNAFKILMFPDTRMFQADNPKAKRQWLDILEETKKKKASMNNQMTETVPDAKTKRTISLDESNPFAEEILAEEQDSSKSEVKPRPVSVSDKEVLSAGWLRELPEDLDVCIAQRDFEGAVDLVNKVNEYLLGCTKSPAIREYRARIDHRIKQLTDVLIHELQLSPERSLRGGPRAVRRAVTQLLRLGKSAQACNLFLENRSALIKYNIRQLKIEGATTLYIKRLCQVFFSCLMETGKEFIKAFPQHFGCFSAFSVWAKKEVEEFIKLFSSQVFVSKSSLNSIADCVSEARTCCDQLKEVNLELTFILDGLLIPDVEKAVTDALDVQVDAVKIRASEDLWQPVNFRNAESLAKFEEEMMELGILDIANYSHDGSVTSLTSNTIHFSKSFLTLASNCLKVYTPEIDHLVSNGIVDILLLQLRYAEQASKRKDLQKEHKTIVQNSVFLVDGVLAHVKTTYEEKTNSTLPRMKDFAPLLNNIKKASRETLGEFV